MVTAGDWSDVLQVLITFLGEAVCLLPSQDLLEAVLVVCIYNLFHTKTVIFSFLHNFIITIINYITFSC